MGIKLAKEKQQLINRIATEVNNQLVITIQTMNGREEKTRPKVTVTVGETGAK